IYFGKKKNKKLNLKDLANNQIKISYYDIVSLYPYICCTGPYPVGKPEYIIYDFNYDLKHSNGKPYFGFIHCKILPPQNLYHPVLGTTVQNKFIFPLCQKCADEPNSLNNYCHTDNERCLEDIWTTEEIKKAIELGYKLKKIYMVIHYDQKSTDLFTNYMNIFF